MRQDVINWLLEENEPSIRYRTMTELLDTPADSPEAKATQAQIADSKPVKKIFAKMHPDGYWEYKGKGAGVDYADYYTTHFNLAFLAELGMTRDDPRIAKAVERYLSFQQPDGDFLRHFSCLYGYNLRTFIMLGYGDDPRTQKIAALMENTERHDGGYLCDMHDGKYKTKLTKSCIRGSVKVLMAYAMLPELWQSPRCQQLVNYFLQRRVIYRRDQPETVIQGELAGTLYPFTWRASLLEPLYALSKMGYGDHPALNDIWALLDSKMDDQGRYILDWTPTNVRFKPGKRHEVNKWVTFYALMALNYRKPVIA